MGTRCLRWCFRGKGQMSEEEKSYYLGSSSSSSRMTSVVRRLSLNRGGSGQRTCRAAALSPPRSPGVRCRPARPPPPLSVSLSDGHVTALPAGGRGQAPLRPPRAWLAWMEGQRHRHHRCRRRRRRRRPVNSITYTRRFQLLIRVRGGKDQWRITIFRALGRDKLRA